MTTEQTRDFWEQRLADDWTVTGVGYRALGRAFNTWMYRVRREVFLREVARLEVDADLDLPRCRVLDVGSGTGFYVALWQELGVASVTGSDLTESAVERLRERFPGTEFHQIDISRPVTTLPPASFDVVSCMDVLFHITDDDGHRTAIRNLSTLVRPGGVVVLSENFVHGKEQRGPRQVNRSLQRIESELREAGLEPVRRRPMFVLMNAQVDAGPLRHRGWGAVLRAATALPGSGWLAGALLYPLERRLVRRRREGPSTEIMICRRTGTT